MAMMNLCSDSREQSDSKMDECCQVADIIREASRCDRQEIGKLGSSKRISNDTPAYPISRSDDTPSSRSRFALPEQDPDSISLEASIPPPGGSTIWGQELGRSNSGALGHSRGTDKALEEKKRSLKQPNA
jgi:hypothetical protein